MVNFVRYVKYESVVRGIYINKNHYNYFLKSCHSKNCHFPRKVVICDFFLSGGKSIFSKMLRDEVFLFEFNRLYNIIITCQWNISFFLQGGGLIKKVGGLIKNSTSADELWVRSFLF